MRFEPTGRPSHYARIVASVNKREMLDMVRRELAHIPTGPFPQQLLRMAFWNMRLNSLGRTPQEPNDPLEVVKRAIAACERQHPATYAYDRDFFENESRRLHPVSSTRPEPYEATLIVDLRPWAKYFPADWVERLTDSLATIKQTIWEQQPNVSRTGPRSVRISLDTYGRSQTDASSNAEALVRHHIPLAGLMDGDYSINVTSAERPLRQKDARAADASGRKELTG